VTALRALIRKEAAVLFGSPVAYLTLAMVGIVTALVFFDHLRIYNQTLFVWSSSTMGGFETDTIPDYINLRVLVFLPVMEQLALMLIGLVPLVTMRVFAEERARGTDELLITTQLSSGRIVAGKFIVAYALVALMLAVSFVYPATSIVTAGLGLRHLAAVYTGLLALGLGIASIGLACSAFTSSQLVAAVSAYAIAFVLYDFTWATQFLAEQPALASFLDQLSMHPRFGGFAEGLVAVPDMVYFAGLGAVSFGLAWLSLDLERVR
jgi:ABC-2 type transport system permease protein